MMQCPSCGRLQEPHLLCVKCQTPLASDLDYFTTLGLPQKLLIDLKTLEQHYHDLGRRVHPDRFANASAKVRAASLHATALLTRAYRTLNDPVTRGIYCLELNGLKLAEKNQQVPAELAAMVFEVQEGIEELRQADRAVLELTRSQLQGNREEVQAQLDDAMNNLDEIFGAIDSAGRASAEQFDQLKLVLAKIAYLKTLMRDVDKALDICAAA